MKRPLSLYFSFLLYLIDDISTGWRYHFLKLTTLVRFSIDLLDNFENFVSVIIIHFVLYDFSLVIFVGFVGGIIISVFNKIILHT